MKPDTLSDVLQTVTIMAYYGNWPVGVAKRLSDGTYDCRVIVEPYSVEVATGQCATERQAVRFLKTSRWTTAIKKIRLRTTAN